MTPPGARCPVPQVAARDEARGGLGSLQGPGAPGPRRPPPRARQQVGRTPAAAGPAPCAPQGAAPPAPRPGARELDSAAWWRKAGARGQGGEPLCAPVRLQHCGQRPAQRGIRSVFVGSYLTNEACASIQVSRDTHFAGAEGRCPPQQRSACWLWSVPTQQERTAVKGRAQTDGCGFRG